MTWDVKITGPAQKDLRKLPAKDLSRIKVALLAIQENPFSGDIVRLKAQPSSWRRRVGSYRIFFDIDTELFLVIVNAVERRTSKTY